MKSNDMHDIEEAEKAALEVLLFNSNGPFDGLPRTAGWGYPEPYTRDLMLSILGIGVSDNKDLLRSFRRVLERLAKNQTGHGHIPSLAHDKEDRGSSDTTPLFLMGVAIFRKVSGKSSFLNKAVEKALRWMEYQSPSDRYLVAQQPTSDWRDEQWVTGYGLFVNTLVYSYLKLLGHDRRAAKISKAINRLAITEGTIPKHRQEGFALTSLPYYALWTYKVHNSGRFDLLGNSIAILAGIASPSRAKAIISWIETECSAMRERGDLASDLPPNFFPFIKRGDSDWKERYEIYNKPGDYHNGGIWPFVCGFYIAALVSVKKYRLAEEKLIALTRLIRTSGSGNVNFGFNEWIKAQNGKPMGQDWQTWSAALYLYAVKCVEMKSTPYFDEIRDNT